MQESGARQLARSPTSPRAPGCARPDAHRLLLAGGGTRPARTARRPNRTPGRPVERRAVPRGSDDDRSPPTWTLRGAASVCSRPGRRQPWGLSRPRCRRGRTAHAAFADAPPDLPPLPNTSVLVPEDLGLDSHQLLELRLIDDRAELEGALIPRLLAPLVQRDAGDLLFLDCHTEIHGSLGPIIAALADHAVLTPRTSGPMPQDDLAPDDRRLLVEGTVSVGHPASGPTRRTSCAGGSSGRAGMPSTILLAGLLSVLLAGSTGRPVLGAHACAACRGFRGQRLRFGTTWPTGADDQWSPTSASHDDRSAVPAPDA